MRLLLGQVVRLACVGALGLSAAGCAGSVTGNRGSPMQTAATQQRVLGWVRADAQGTGPVERQPDGDGAARWFWASLQVSDPSQMSRAEQEALIARAIAEHEMRHP